VAEKNRNSKSESIRPLLSMTSSIHRVKVVTNKSQYQPQVLHCRKAELLIFTLL